MNNIYPLIFMAVVSVICYLADVARLKVVKFLNGYQKWTDTSASGQKLQAMISLTMDTLTPALFTGKLTSGKPNAKRLKG